MFRITRGKGFHVSFDNGYTVSVQFGTFNYCDNRDHNIGYSATAESEAAEKGCINAETAVWGPDGAMIQFPDDSDQVQGWQTVAQVLARLNWAASQPGTIAVKPVLH